MSSCIRNAPFLLPLNNNISNINANVPIQDISPFPASCSLPEDESINKNEQSTAILEKTIGERPRVQLREGSVDLPKNYSAKRTLCPNPVKNSKPNRMSDVLDPLLRTSDYMGVTVREDPSQVTLKDGAESLVQHGENERRKVKMAWARDAGNKVLRKGTRESDEEFAKRVRKHNYLSLAQEYVAQKNASTRSQATKGRKDVEDPNDGWVRYVRPVLEARPANAAANSEDWRRRVAQGSGTGQKVDTGGKVPAARGSGALRRVSDARSSSPDCLGSFDVYNIETAMPAIDWAAVEEHLARAALEEKAAQRQHRNDREEIRRKLAMGPDTEDYYAGERTGKRPSLQSRLQSGMNLQICFMNETAADQDTVTGDVAEKPDRKSPSPEKEVRAEESVTDTTSVAQIPVLVTHPPEEPTDFVSRQAKLQAEARLALAQAKQMARMQIEVERQRKKKSPIAEMVGILFPDCRRKLSRHVLSDMNVAQLQVIVNDLHTQIENLNEELVHLLLERDDLHMEQDSMLVDIEDLTRYLGAKDEALRETRGKGPATPHQLVTKYRFKNFK